jgi:hypothetical protein
MPLAAIDDMLDWLTTVVEMSILNPATTICTRSACSCKAEEDPLAVPRLADHPSVAQSHAIRPSRSRTRWKLSTGRLWLIYSTSPKIRSSSKCLLRETYRYLSNAADRDTATASRISWLRWDKTVYRPKSAIKTSPAIKKLLI